MLHTWMRDRLKSLFAERSNNSLCGALLMRILLVQGSETARCNFCFADSPCLAHCVKRWSWEFPVSATNIFLYIWKEIWAAPIQLVRQQTHSCMKSFFFVPHDFYLSLTSKKTPGFRCTAAELSLLEYRLRYRHFVQYVFPPPKSLKISTNLRPYLENVGTPLFSIYWP